MHAMHSVSLAVLDRQSTVMWVNQSWEANSYAGYTPLISQCFTGTNFLELYHQLSQAHRITPLEPQQALQDLFNGHINFVSQPYKVASNGHARTYLIEGSLLAGDHGYAYLSHRELSAADKAETLPGSQAASPETPVYHDSSLFTQNSAVMLLIDPRDGQIIDANPAALAFYGYDLTTIKAMTIDQINTLTPYQIKIEMDQAASNRRHFFNFKHRLASGRIRDVEVFSSPVHREGDKLLYSIIHDVTEKHTIEHQQNLLYRLTAELRTAAKADDVMQTVLRYTLELLQGDAAAILTPEQSSGWQLVQAAAGSWAVLQGTRLENPDTAGGPPGTTRDNQRLSVLGLPLSAQHNKLGKLWVGRWEPAQASSSPTFSQREKELLETVADITASALQQAELHAAALDYAARMAAVTRVGRTLAEIMDPRQIYNQLSAALDELLPETHAVDILSYATSQEELQLVFNRKQGLMLPRASQPGIKLSDPGREAERSALHSRRVQTRELAGENLEKQPDDNERPAGISTQMCVPMLAKGQVIGLLKLHSRAGSTYSEQDQELVALLASMAAAALQNASLLENVQRGMQRLTALRTIDTAIISSMDLELNLEIILKQVLEQLQASAAAIYLYNGKSHSLEFGAGKGFRSSQAFQTNHSLADSLAGKVAISRKLLIINDLRSHSGTVNSIRPLLAEGFVSFIAAPLIVKSELRGVLQVLFRNSFEPDQGWLDYLEALAGQSAIAIDNVTMFNTLQRSNIDLNLAYDTTLEGWARTLELRDAETESHTRRVTELTVRLATAMNIRAEEILHIRRGAMLHDIGKMAIPDAILNKPGPLTDSEWEIMRQHPLTAVDLLSPVSYLKPALEIPHFHHEKWDGSGYPEGRRGTQIPLPARIFAVVDVYDALSSDRPYRAAWPREKVIAYLREQAGSHFDPEVVKIFLDQVCLLDA